MRGRFNTFVARHEVPWELTMAVLAALYMVVGFATDDAPEGLVSNLAVVDLALTVIFVVEFASRCSSPPGAAFASFDSFACCGSFGHSQASTGLSRTTSAWLDTAFSWACSWHGSQ